MKQGLRVNLAKKATVSRAIAIGGLKAKVTPQEGKAGVGKAGHLVKADRAKAAGGVMTVAAVVRFAPISRPILSWIS